MTSSTEPGETPAPQLLKVDSRGRVQVSPERRAALLEEFDRSGMTGAAFARHYGVKYTTFAYWVRARKEARRARQKNDKFLLVTTDAVSNTKGVLIELPYGASLTVADAAQAELAGAVIRALGTES